jgi:hypothetical protein
MQVCIVAYLPPLYLSCEIIIVLSLTYHQVSLPDKQAVFQAVLRKREREIRSLKLLFL